LGLFRESADSQGIAYALNGLGELAWLAGDCTAAMTLQTESLDLFQKLGNKRDAAWSLCGLGEIAWHQGNYALARSHCQASRALFEELGIPSGLLIVLHHLAQVERKEGNLGLAACYYTQSLAMSQATRRNSMIARCLAGLGGVALGQGQPERAARLLGAAYLLFETLSPFLSSADWAEYDQLLSKTRSQLDEPAFAAAWAEGRAQSLDQVIASALVVTP
jgi:ATP/maltotriose-dependent transcriptional regulator MalT